MVADALDVLGREQQVRAQADVARILHHVGEQLAEQRIVHGVDTLVATPHGNGLLPVALGVCIEHVLELAQRQLDHVLETRHERLGMVLAGHGQGPLGDILGEVARALQVAGDLEHRHDVAQVDGHGLAPGDHLDGEVLDLALQGIDLAVLGDDALGELRVTALQRVEAPRQQLLHLPAHLGDLLVEQLQLLVERPDDVLMHVAAPPGQRVAVMERCSRPGPWCRDSACPAASVAYTATKWPPYDTITR